MSCRNYFTMRLRLLIIVLLAATALSLYAKKTIVTPKDTVFYNRYGGFIRPCIRKEAIAYGFKTPFNPDTYIRKIFYLSNQQPMLKAVVCDTFLLNIYRKPEIIITQQTGDYLEWYDNGQRMIECTYKNDQLDGEYKLYNSDGSLARFELWENGVWKQGEIYDAEGKHIEKCAYLSEPSFKGGIVAYYKFIMRKLDEKHVTDRYDKLRRVQVGFVVNEQGGLEDINIINSQLPDFEKQLIDIFREMPDWNPAYSNGKPVRMHFTMNFRFMKNFDDY